MELRPCPFCGNDRIVDISEIFPGKAKCFNCGATAPNWNVRPLEGRLASGKETPERMMDKFIVVKDGDSWFFALPDFVNLQESDAIFLPVYNADMDYIFELLNNQQDVKKRKNEKYCWC